MEATDKIWHNGELVDWADGKVHLAAHGLHYGSGVFEGMRAYETVEGPAVFRLRDHLERFGNSARILHMELPYSLEELRSAVLEVVAVNGLSECYIRPIAFYGYGDLGVVPGENPIDVAVITFPWGAYLGREAQEQGITLKISTWRRMGSNSIPHAAKATGIYVNSMLAALEARRAGYGEALLLTEDGFVADGPTVNIFAVKGGRLSTPALSASILRGITRDTVLQLAVALGYDAVEKPLIRTDLYTADELFVAGTAAEITPVRAIDDVEVPAPGPITAAIQAEYVEIVHGRREAWSHLLAHAVGGGAERRGRSAAIGGGVAGGSSAKRCG
jgi:branched-chain amino acid aminotransferase